MGIRLEELTVDRQEFYAKLAGAKGDARVLDIGYAQEPNPYLRNVYGADISGKRPANYVSVAQVDLNIDSLPYADGFFSGVIIGDVIEHVENPSRVLRDINRVLKPGGRFVLATPNASYYAIFLHNLLRRFVLDPDKGEHLSNWTIIDMVRLLKRNGFAVEKVYGDRFMVPKTQLWMPMRRFPMLSYRAIYAARKVAAPDRNIYSIRDGERVIVAKPGSVGVRSTARTLLRKSKAKNA
jgi:SAM-dependent methyltransferase